MLRVASVSALALLLSGCASAHTGASAAGDAGAAATRAPRRDANVLTAAEIESRGANTGSAYDAVARLRRSFLTYHGFSGGSTGGAVLASVDGSALSGVAALRSVSARNVAEIRYLSAVDAAQRYGTTANSSPVVLVTQK